MTTIRKRRWLLAFVALAAVAVAAGFAVFREEPKDDLPRLVVLGQEQVTKGYEVPFFVVLFRFEAPKHTGAGLQQVITQSPSTGEERGLVGVGLGGGRVRYEVFDQPSPPSGVAMHYPPLRVEAGQSTEFSVVRPVDDVWRLRCHFARDYSGVRSLPTRVRWCLLKLSFAPLFWKLSGPREEIESELITNAIPPAADVPSK